MGRYTQEISRLKGKYKALYSPTTAFGNLELLDIQNQINQEEEKLEGKKECDECNGWGTVNCGACGHDHECTECEDGLIEI